MGRLLDAAPSNYSVYLLSAVLEIHHKHILIVGWVDGQIRRKARKINVSGRILLFIFHIKMRETIKSLNFIGKRKAVSVYRETFSNIHI